MVVALLGLACLGAGPSSGPSAGDPIPSVEGRWAQRMVMTSLSNPPVIGTVTSRTVTHLVVDVRQHGEKIELTAQTCDIDIENSVNVVDTVVPPAFVHAIPQARREGRLVRSDGDFRIEIDRSWTVFGAKLRQPETETLPTDRDDRRVLDSDGDDHPGITIRVSGLVSGKLYLVQRSWDRYSGRLTPDGDIVGTVDWHVEQTVLGSNSIFLRDAPAAEPHPDDNKIHFAMVRIPSDADCQWLDRHRQVFPD
ncbi:MAG: hypothetical protein ABEN55_22310 [Bradymonadaceae bacterium]